MSNTNKNINELKKAYKRKAKKYTQESLAKYCKISQPYLALILSSKRKCPDKIYNKILKYINNL